MANVLFKRLEDSSELDNMPVIDGSLYITKDGKTFIDYDEDRIPVGGTPDTEMSDRSTNTVENNVIKNYVDTNFQANGKILWTNSSPSSSFSSQNITLSSNDYDMLLFIYKGYNNSNIQYSTQIIKGGDTRLIFMGGGELFYRTCNYVNDTTYTINNESASTNSRCIPLYIIGYKTGLFD